MATSDRGFKHMEASKQREIASKGGKSAHEKGTAHTWTSAEAREAGRKGGLRAAERRRLAVSGVTAAAGTVVDA